MLIAIEASHANKPKRTGVEETCWRLIQELKKQIPSDVKVVLYSNTPLRGELGVLPPNWSVKILKWPFKKMWSQVRLSWEFLSNKPDVFFAPGQLVPFISPKKTVSVVHDSAFLVYPETYGFWGRKYLKWMNKLLLKRSAAIITPSEFSKEELKKFYPKLVKNKDISVVPWGYDQGIYRILDDPNKSDSVLKRFNLKNPYLMFLGRIETKKNVANIIKAFDILKKKYEDLQLLLAGKQGRGYDKIKETLENSPYKMDIFEAGWVNEEDLPILLNNAEAFVFPTLYEGFGLPVLNAMACGCSVVVSQNGCGQEVAKEAGFYCQPENISSIANTIEILLNNKELKQEKIEKGLEIVKDFSWEKTAREVWKLLSV